MRATQINLVAIAGLFAAFANLPFGRAAFLND